MKLCKSLLLLCMALTACESSKPTYYTVISYSQSGVEIVRYEHAFIIDGRSGWVKFYDKNLKEVMIDGPHTWIQE